MHPRNKQLGSAAELLSVGGRRIYCPMAGPEVVLVLVMQEVIEG